MKQAILAVVGVLGIVGGAAIGSTVVVIVGAGLLTLALLIAK